MVEMYLLGDHTRPEGATGIPESGCAVARAIVPIPRAGWGSLQLVCVADGDLEPMDVRISGLGEACARAEMFVEWFHNIRGRMLPDALIPLGQGGAAFGPLQFAGDWPGQRARAVWIDIHVSAEAVPGEYPITVLAGGQALGATLRVLPFVLPAQPGLVADMNCYADSLSPLYAMLASNKSRYDDGSFIAVDQATHRLIQTHRCAFHNLPYDHAGLVIPSFAPVLAGAGHRMRVSDWTPFDAHFAPLLSGAATGDGLPIPFMYLPFNFDWPSSYEKWGTQGYITENQRVLADFITHFEQMGWTGTVFELFLNHKKRYRFFPYDGDEVRFAQDEAIFELQRTMFYDMIDKASVRIVIRADSSWRYGRHFDSPFTDYVRMWVVNGTIYRWYPEAVSKMRARGNLLFSYSQLPSIAEPLAQSGMRMLSAYMTGQRGVTFWNSTDCGAKWRTTPTADGAVCCMYPGEPFGLHAPLPSIRLKAMRNALNACDLLMMMDEVRAQELVNAVLGTQLEDWWSPKPSFEHQDPSTWIGARLSEAAPRSTGLAVPADTFHTLLDKTSSKQEV